LARSSDLKRVEIIGPEYDDTVRTFLGGSAQATIYHTPRWRDVLVATYGYEPLYLGCFEQDRLTAVLPLMLVKSWLTGRRLVSLPFSNTCGPIGSPEDSAALVDEALRLYRDRQADAVEIRTQPDVQATVDDRFTNLSYFITSIVMLDEDPEKVWKRFKDRNVRTEVRQAEKKGVKVRAGDGEKDLGEFYSLFAASRLQHGVPPQPFRFFRNLWRHLWPDYLDLFVASHDGRTVGGLITLRSGRNMCAAYIGSDAAYRSYRVHQLLFWKAMETGCRRGHTGFDFLRTPKNSDSLRYFKRRWNASEFDLLYMYHPEIRGTASTIEETTKYRLMTAVLRRSPVVVGKLLGRALYRHLG
jgi:CelD/BcsL family acetyltransferase involved in cellulose biosynthesis